MKVVYKVQMMGGRLTDKRVEGFIPALTAPFINT